MKGNDDERKYLAIFFVSLSFTYFPLLSRTFTYFHLLSPTSTYFILLHLISQTIYLFLYSAFPTSSPVFPNFLPFFKLELLTLTLFTLNNGKARKLRTWFVSPFLRCHKRKQIATRIETTSCFIPVCVLLYIWISILGW